MLLTSNSPEMTTFRHTTAEIDLCALTNNLQQVRKRVANTHIMAVIKADAYGHGLFAVADKLTQSDAFAVACVDEGILLRAHGVTKPIIILEGYSSKSELVALIENKLTPVINNCQQLDLLLDRFSSQAGKVSVDNDIIDHLSIWLKFDTGMHRLGFNLDQIQSILKSVKKISSKLSIYGLMSHFANADEQLSDKINNQQLSLFEQIRGFFTNNNTINSSMANSAAILTLPKSYYQWVRPGIMLYGVNPLTNFNQSGNTINTIADSSVELQAVMTLRSQLIAINHLQKGDCIGYGGNWCCPEDMPVGVVAIGYGDGYPRHAISGTPVLINGIRTQLIGRVSMDMITIDLRPLINSKMTANIGDTVTLWGKGLAVEEVAHYSGTIAYELLCGIGNRVNYLYTETEEVS